MDEHGDPSPAGDATLVGHLVAHGQRGSFPISVVDTFAIGISIGALVALNQVAAPDHLPFLVASFASSAFVPFSLPGLDIARTWNVVGGLFLGALSSFLSVTVLGPGQLALVAGASVALACVLMQVCHTLHPPRPRPSLWRSTTTPRAQHSSSSRCWSASCSSSCSPGRSGSTRPG